jgi:tryptophan-rich sensory protein
MQWIALLLWLVVCFAVAGIGGWWTSGELTGWYRSLEKPAITPPNWVFGPVWTLLYALMAIAAWQVWLTAPSPLRSRALVLFLVQLGLNLVWAWTFFHEHEIRVALANVAVLWIAVGLTTLVFGRIAPVAAWLMAPYWAWVTFATLLNAGFCLLNKRSGI